MDGNTVKPIQALYCGIQDGVHPFELWTILESMDCECHTVLSTLSLQTIRAHGFEPVQQKEK